MAEQIKIKVEIYGIGKSLYWNQAVANPNGADKALDAGMLQTFLDEFFQSFTDDCCDIYLNGEEQWNRNIDNGIHPDHTEQRRMLAAISEALPTDKHSETKLESIQKYKYK